METSAPNLPTPDPSSDLRIADRFDTVMPVEMEGMEAWTRNISATGIYFESSDAQEVGSRVKLHIEFRQGGRLHRLQCEGEVVRITNAGERIGVAARLLTPFFAQDEEPIITME